MRRARAIAWGVALTGAAMLAAPAARAAVEVGGLALADTGLFAPVAERWRAAERAFDAAPAGPARVRLALALGRVDPACSLAVAALGADGGGAAARERALASLRAARSSSVEHPGHDAGRAWAEATFARDGTLDEETLAALEGGGGAMQRLAHAARFGRDDAAAVDRATSGALAREAGSGSIADLLAAGRLALDQMATARAESCFARVIEHEARGPDRVSALNGLAMVAQRRRDWDGALERSRQALAEGTSSDALETLAQSLIRLGRTDEAIAAAEWSATLDPYAARAEAAFDPSHAWPHYLLGNGYARMNYTQLLNAYPRAFADAAGRKALAAADARLARGQRAGARAAYAAVVAAHPGWADARVRLASLDFEDARFDSAIAGCFAALRACPHYGRARAVLSRALEGKRFLVDVHRAEYERRFAAAPMPDVPGLSRFVVNWRALSPRHQKRVALSVAPWKAFIPVLVEGGATFYIKPMYQLLSESPGQRTLRDQRIDYDSRLWDDVRGCGGYRTVTGIEDVERTIFDRYDTVVHELTHQVHGLLPADDARAIEEDYRAAKSRDRVETPGFLSRYAAGSVWEYFAEGANALNSPRRDAYDPREVVRERLDATDPALRARVERFQSRTDVSASYPVAYANAGDDEVSNGRVDAALPYYRKALARAPREEAALRALVGALTLKGDGRAAVAAAERAVAAHPASGPVRVATADARWHAGHRLDAVRAGLDAARPAVRAADLLVLDIGRGRLAWVAGDAPAALAAFDSALARQADSPEALRGRAEALALAGRWDEAFADYDQAVRLRTGIVDLRNAYARDLLRAGRLDGAAAQLESARLLDPLDPDAEALRGALALARGDADSAAAHARRALALGDWCDLARVVLGGAERKRGDAAAAAAAWAPLERRIAGAAPPAYVYREALSTWQEVHTLPAVLRRMLEAYRRD